MEKTLFASAGMPGTKLTYVVSAFGWSGLAVGTSMSAAGGAPSSGMGVIIV